jgi:hypothetical protein
MYSFNLWNEEEGLRKERGSEEGVKKRGEREEGRKG